MAEFTTGKSTFAGGEEIGMVFHQGDEMEFAFGRGTQIFPNAPIEIYGRTQYRVVEASDQQVFEVGFAIDTELSGNAATGWTDAGNYLRFELEQSEDLSNWAMGKFVPAPVPVVDLGGGSFQYWARLITPIKWRDTLIDFRAASNRYGKEIVGLNILGTAVSLPNYPYYMPADAAQLQADLRANGYPGAVVTGDSGTPILVQARNHQPGSARGFYFALSGSNVTGVRYPTTSDPLISLPSYPYSMPAQRAALQADLRAAGYSGAVVRLLAGDWEIFLPDIAAPPSRYGSVTFTPGDPFPVWDFFGNYLGDLAGDYIPFESENTRDPSGNPLQELPSQFARLKISAGSRYNPYR